MDLQTTPGLAEFVLVALIFLEPVQIADCDAVIGLREQQDPRSRFQPAILPLGM